MPSPLAPGRRWLGLIGFLLVCLAISALGGLITAGSVDTWYPTLRKPVFNPPDWLFAPVWTTLFLMIAVAGWRVWCRAGTAGRNTALGVYGLQLALNLLWSVLFFGLQRVDLAALEVVVLLSSIAWTIRLFHRIDRIAAWLLVPYLLWVAFATALTIALWLLN